MNIKRKSQIGGTIIVGTIVLTVMIAAFGINRIRFGGEIYRQNQQISDFVADILPPPSYVLEPYLEATTLIANPDAFVTHRERLKRLEAEFRTEEKRWAQSDIDADLKQRMTTQSNVTANRFWAELNGSLLPAAAQHDMPAMMASYRRLSDLYSAHRGQIDALVLAAQNKQSDLTGSSNSTLIIICTVLAMMAIAIIALVMGGIAVLSWLALKPMATTAQTMGEMAAGNLDVGKVSDHRDDEIGEMTRAIEVFRQTAVVQRDAAARQAAVVAALTGGLDELAGGNLLHRINETLAPEYEALRQSFNATLDQLGRLIGSVTHSASQVNNGASEIRAASDDLARRNEAQASNIEETVAAMRSVTQIIRQGAQSAIEVQKSIIAAHNQAAQGGAVVSRTTSAMAAIEASSQEISQIINVIDGIAFQTNLLALNAGVEAARAGDSGKGFAVVASEVRALAQRATDAAKDIKALILCSSQQVGEGVTLVAETGTLLSEIAASVGEVNGMIGTMAKDSQEQVESLTTVNQSIEQIDRVTQQNAAMAEQATAAARSLAEEATSLTGTVAHFRVAKRGSGQFDTAQHAPSWLPSEAMRKRA